MTAMNYYIINDSSTIVAAYKAEQVLMTVYLNSNMNVREGQELQEDREGKGRVFFAGADPLARNANQHRG